MIAAAVVCPHPPGLLRELTGGEDVLADLRRACHEALGSALSGDPDLVLVVGGAAETCAWDPGVPLGIRRFGTTSAPDPDYLPLSLGVGRRLLEEAGWEGRTALHSVAWDAAPDVWREVARLVGRADRVLLVVMADGSARRGEKAPGHLDERALSFDDEVGKALADGDADALARLDARLAADLLAQGRAALAVLGAWTAEQGGRPKVEVLYRDDPFGVMYTVAAWQLTA